MKRLIMGVAAALMLGAPAFADGLPSRGKARGDDDNGSVRWRGFYVGGHAGLAVGNTDSQLDKPLPLTFDYEVNGGLYGIQAGLLGQWGNVVAGIEATYSGSTIQGSDGGCAVVPIIGIGVNCARDVNWVATVVGRAGVAYDRVLLYGLAGVAWADVETTVGIINNGLASASGGETHVGWTAGFGLEWALSNRISARIEYAHIDLGEETHQIAGKLPLDVNLEMDTVRLGVNVKLGH
jgi:outer membrane immunogenic protein